MDKVVKSAREAVADIGSGSSLAVGGFGLCGVPSVLIGALLESGVGELEVVSNNCGFDGWRLGDSGVLHRDWRRLPGGRGRIALALWRRWLGRAGLAGQGDAHLCHAGG